MVENNQVSENCTSHKYSKEELLQFKTSKSSQHLPPAVTEKFEIINGFLDPVLSFDYMEPAHYDIASKKSERPREDKDYHYGTNKRNFSKGNRNNQPTRIDNATLFAEVRRGSPHEQRILTERNQHIQSLLDEPIDLFGNRGRNIYSEVKAQLTKDEIFGPKAKDTPMEVDSGEKPNSRFQFLFLDRHKKPEIDAVTQAVRDRDKQLLDLIQGTTENRKQKITAKKTAREVENLLKGILMKNKDKPAEIDPNILQLPRGVNNNQVKTLDEVESSIIQPESNGGNKGAGDMSNFYKLLGFFRNSSNLNHQQQHESNSKASNNSNSFKSYRTPLYASGAPPTSVSNSDQNNDHYESDGSSFYDNGSVFNPEQMAMFYRSMHPPPSQQYPSRYSPNNIGGACGFSADRWLKAMKNAMSASACINQMQQPGFENQHNLYNNIDNADHCAYGEDNIGVVGHDTCGQVNNSSPSFDSSNIPNGNESLAMKFQRQVNVYDGYLPASTTFLPRTSALSANYSPDVYNRMSVIMGLVAPHLNSAIPTSFKAGFRLPYYSAPNTAPVINPLVLQQMVRINNMQQQMNTSFRAKSALSSNQFFKPHGSKFDTGSSRPTMSNKSCDYKTKNDQVNEKHFSTDTLHKTNAKIPLENIPTVNDNTTPSSDHKPLVSTDKSNEIQSNIINENLLGDADVPDIVTNPEGEQSISHENVVPEISLQ